MSKEDTRGATRKQREHYMDERKLEDLFSVGQAIRRDFELLGIHTVAELAKHEPDDLYHQLCRKTGTRLDPCVLDTFRAAVAQARDPKLPLEQCRWWYWSRVRRASMKGNREKVSQ